MSHVSRSLLMGLFNRADEINALGAVMEHIYVRTDKLTIAVKMVDTGRIIFYRSVSLTKRKALDCGRVSDSNMSWAIDALERHYSTDKVIEIGTNALIDLATCFEVYRTGETSFDNNAVFGQEISYEDILELDFTLREGENVQRFLITKDGTLCMRTDEGWPELTRPE